MTAHIHDALFRYAFADPADAAGELREVLPAPLAVAALDWDQIEVLPGPTFVDETLESRQVDLLYRVPLRGSDVPALVYVLFEHQSSVDAMMPARLLVYVSRILDQWMRENPSARRLPCVLPVVIHHSRSGWTATRDLQSLFDLPESLREAVSPHVPAFTFILDDLTQASEAELEARAQSALARLALLCFRSSRADQPVEVVRWARLVNEVVRQPDGARALMSIFRYLSQVRDDDLCRQLVIQSADPIIEELAMNYEQQLIQQGIEKGREEGAARLLLRLAQLKFGELGEAYEERIRAASAADLERWTESILAVESIDELLR